LCYYNDGFGGEPALKYKLDDRVFKPDPQHKIMGVLLYHCHMVSCVCGSVVDTLDPILSIEADQSL
jgi:hypothetical protein